MSLALGQDSMVTDCAEQAMVYDEKLTTAEKSIPHNLGRESRESQWWLGTGGDREDRQAEGL